MINELPIIGWLLSLIGNISLSVPFWFCWTHCGIGKKFFYFAPEVYQSISFWNCVGLFIVLSVLRGLFPNLVEVDNSNSNK